jgi:hypothetical protein
MLAAAIQESGTVDLAAIYKKPADSIYSLMVTDSRRQGARFTFLGNGMFCAVGVEPEPAEVRAGADLARPGPRTPKSLAVVNGVVGTCGDCAMFTYNGVEVVRQTLGACGYAASGRDYVKPSAAGCPGWRRKPQRTLEKERKERLETMALVSKINATVHSARRTT